CGTGKVCKAAGDCVSLVCAAVCQVASCTDFVKNGSETDIDCGGGACGACTGGAACRLPSDCRSSVCTARVCQTPGCAGSVRNGTETDVDCGGTCSPCPPGS